MDTLPKRGRGRPAGRDFEITKSLRFRPEDNRRMQALASLKGCSEAAVVRAALQEMAKREGLE